MKRDMIPLQYDDDWSWESIRERRGLQLFDTISNVDEYEGAAHFRAMLSRSVSEERKKSVTAMLDVGYFYEDRKSRRGL